MNKLFTSTFYKWFIYLLVLAPNLFVVVVGIESFPFTSAPMFAHHIDKNSDLYVFKFEGVTKANDTLNLQGFYGKSERDFVRHFFGKAYGVAAGENPFSNQLEEDNQVKFKTRMQSFFNNYSTFLQKEYNLNLETIILSIKKVDYYRNDLSNYELIGKYNCNTNVYSYGEEKYSVNY